MRFVSADLVVLNRWAIQVNPLMELAEEKRHSVSDCWDFCDLSQQDV